MSLHLGPRHKWASRRRFSSVHGEYSVFNNVSPSHTPGGLPSAETTCFACDHSWIAHKNDAASVAPENRRFIKGGADHGRCGSFHSDLALWNMRTIRLCGRPWAAHDRPSQLGLWSHESEVSSIPTSSSGSLISLQRPALAYAGISRRPTAVTVQQERQASIYMTLPQYQSSVGPSSAPANPRSKKRLSGPPRPCSSAPAATLADFSTASLKVKITVGILLKVIIPDSSQYAALRVPDGRSGDTIRTVVSWSCAI
ncbi:hypothetical protein DFH09DRAFT_1277256 [Mycena vulgaris]|nr:hypothetical protein DFH09DRAFT_1277256 [Mycena vulgaris]